jgi:hypothetical protein
MRVIAQISDPRCLISIFAWNQKYIVKCEVGGLEQSFKIDFEAVTSVDELRSKLTSSWLDQVVARFVDMEASRAAICD